MVVCTQCDVIGVTIGSISSSSLPVMKRAASTLRVAHSLRAAALRPSRPASIAACFSSAAAPAVPTPALTPTERIQQDMRYCVQQVKQHDNDQYLCSLLLPRSARAGVHVVRAFNLELAHVEARHAIPTVGGPHALQEVFSEEAKAAQAQRMSGAALRQPRMPTEAEENQMRVGLMKLHWWRDGMETAMENVERLRLQPTPARVAATAAVDADGDGSSIAAHAQPVLNMLAIVSKQYRLTHRWLSRMIEARERSLSDGQPADINALLAHAESTSSALLYLTLECMGVRDVHADHAASHIGKALGILLTIRSLPYNASKRQIFLPRTIIESEDVDVGSVLSGQNSDALANCVFELASIARAHVQHARQLAPQVPKEAVPALMSSVLCDRFLARLEAHQFNVFDPALGLLPTAPKGSTDPLRDASIAGVTLSGSHQGIQPMVLRMQLLQHKWKGTY